MIRAHREDALLSTLTRQLAGRQIDRRTFLRHAARLRDVHFEVARRALVALDHVRSERRDEHEAVCEREVEFGVLGRVEARREGAAQWGRMRLGYLPWKEGSLARNRRRARIGRTVRSGANDHAHEPDPRLRR